MDTKRLGRSLLALKSVDVKQLFSCVRSWSSQSIRYDLLLHDFSRPTIVYAVVCRNLQTCLPASGQLKQMR